MNYNSILADSLSIIRNGISSKLLVVKVRKSKFMVEILNLMYLEGYINGYSLDGTNLVKVYLKYSEGFSVIKKIKIESKPGCRVYRNYKYLWKLFTKDHKIVVCSTTMGILTNKEIFAKRLNIGGEILFEIV